MKNKTTLEQARSAKETLDLIKFRLNIGKVDYYAAKKEAEPHLQVLNSYLIMRAKDFGVRPHKVHFATWMR